jgi:hypothetical protein
MTGKILKKSKHCGFWFDGGEELWERYAALDGAIILDEDHEVMLLPCHEALEFQCDAEEIDGYDEEPVEFEHVDDYMDVARKAQIQRMRERENLA